MRTKAVVPFLQKHIPGNPTIVIQYMDGGGGRKRQITFINRSSRMASLLAGCRRHS
jgi:hypothetical protein